MLATNTSSVLLLEWVRLVDRGHGTLPYTALNERIVGSLDGTFKSRTGGPFQPNFFLSDLKSSFCPSSN